MKHVPGPWEWRDGGVYGNDGATPIRLVDPNTESIYTIAQANAKLIEAAPEMLKALQSIVHFNEDNPALYDGDDDHVLGTIMHNAYEAIAKAEGE